MASRVDEGSNIQLVEGKEEARSHSRHSKTRLDSVHITSAHSFDQK
jgi:hypothetical protein